MAEQDRQKAREVASQIASYYLQAGPEHSAMVLTMQNAIAAYGEEVRRETWRAAKETVSALLIGDTALEMVIEALEAAAKK